jgi:hypothetical protein
MPFQDPKERVLVSLVQVGGGLEADTSATDPIRGSVHFPRFSSNRRESRREAQPFRNLSGDGERVQKYISKDVE